VDRVSSEDKNTNTKQQACILTGSSSDIVSGKSSAENPEVATTKVLSVKKEEGGQYQSSGSFLAGGQRSGDL